MQTKTCSKCKIEKLIREYHKDNRNKNGIQSRCKLCRNEYSKKNKEKIKIKNKKYNEKNREKINKQKREYNRSKKNKEKRKEYDKKNREKINKRQKKYLNERYKNDLQFKTMINVRTRLRKYLESEKIQKNNRTILSVGCSKEHLTNWIKYNLDLDNLNEYHIDHVIPLASFNCKTYEEVIESKCNHWTNLMPTSPEYNLIKHNREPTKHELFKQELRIKLFKLKSIII